MKIADLQKWMRENDVTEIDIAAFLKKHPVAIKRNLKGETLPQRSTVDGYRRFIEWFSANKKQKSDKS